jgi:hypothetical protein
MSCDLRRSRPIESEAALEKRSPRLYRGRLDLGRYGLGKRRSDPKLPVFGVDRFLATGDEKSPTQPVWSAYLADDNES